MDSSECKRAVVLTLSEASALLGIHPNTLRSLATRGLIPGGKVGRGWRFIAADLLDGIRAQYASGEVSELKSSRATTVSPDLSSANIVAPASQAWTEARLDTLLERRSPGLKPS
jgi:excisionase family DNA binding protein